MYYFYTAGEQSQSPHFVIKLTILINHRVFEEEEKENHCSSRGDYNQILRLQIVFLDFMAADCVLLGRDG